MKTLALVAFMLASTLSSYAQSAIQEVSPAQLQAVKQREIYKAPLNAAFERQVSMSGKDCRAELKQGGQQGYNICMGLASVQADKDLAIFYNNLQLLCHNQNELTTMQASDKAWHMYVAAIMQSAHAAWPDGTGASGFAGGIYLSVVRDHIRELDEVYGLYIAQ